MRAVGRFVLAKLVKKDQGGLIMKSDLEDSMQTGIVVSTGRGYWLEGAVQEHDVSSGDTIYWQKFAESGAIFQHEGEDHAFISATQIMGVEDGR